MATRSGWNKIAMKCCVACHNPYYGYITDKLHKKLVYKRNIRPRSFLSLTCSKECSKKNTETIHYLHQRIKYMKKTIKRLENLKLQRNSLRGSGEILSDDGFGHESQTIGC